MSISIQRKVEGYPCHKYYCLFKGYIAKKDVGVSEGIEITFRAFFDKMSAQEQQEYLDQYKLNQNKKSKK